MEHDSIHVLMTRVLGELPAIGKNRRNVQQGFMFRGIDDVLNALNPLLAKHGVFYMPRVLDRVVEKRDTSRGGVMHCVHLHVEYTFYGPNGDSVAGSAWGEGTDSGDKATSKAMTMAEKSCLFQVFAISDEETGDPDAETAKATDEETGDPDAETAKATVRPRSQQQDRPARNAESPTSPTADGKHNNPHAQAIHIYASQLKLPEAAMRAAIASVTGNPSASSVTRDNAAAVRSALDAARKEGATA